ncbi:hypothetical protein [Neobacillus muris]|uniref:hypothetical protein n=1 Tax=Neobacillus muris TaxID=2941334 RepID=UPI00203C3C5F|nr:hypothetical protein [Neobacillus muris]
MNFSKEERLSQYIDRLNQQIHEADGPADQDWMDLMDTVHLIKLSNAIDMPAPDFQDKGRQRIKQELAERQPKAAPVKPPKKRTWKKYYMPLAAACLVGLSITLPSFFPEQKAEAEQIRAVKEEQLVSLGMEKANNPMPLSDGESIGFEKDEKIVSWNQVNQVIKEFPNDSFQYMRSPAWSPDEKRIAFSGYQTKNAGIWLMDQNGSNVRQLAAPESPDEFYDHPTWSPDGRKIAFAKQRYAMNDSHGHTQTGEEIWMLEIETGKLTKITDGSEPSWSPDGKMITYTKTQKSGGKEVWVIHLDGSDPLKLTEGMEPDWSPDGQFITFARNSSTRQKAEGIRAEIVSSFREIWAIHVDSKKESRLTESKIDEQELDSLKSSSQSETSDVPQEFVLNGQYSDWQPHWSKDGKAIVFVRDANEESGNHFSLMKIILKYE